MGASAQGCRTERLPWRREAIEIGKRIIGQDQVPTTALECSKKIRAVPNEYDLAPNRRIRKRRLDQLRIIGVVFEKKDVYITLHGSATGRPFFAVKGQITRFPSHYLSLKIGLSHRSMKFF